MVLKIHPTRLLIILRTTVYISPDKNGVTKFLCLMLEGDGKIGFDAARNEYVNLIENGIVDPTKVVRIALENAVSVASVLLLTEATITETEELDKDAAEARAVQF